MKSVLAIGLAGILLVGSTACAVWRDETRNPDRVLFMRAASAIEDQKFGVARLSLETLINTYPESEYKARADELLRDPRILNEFVGNPRAEDPAGFFPR